MPLTTNNDLPDPHSPHLVLSHPTSEELVIISTNTSVEWKDSLTLPVYLKESSFLATVPLARDGGLTPWILVDKALAPGRRQILSSCESFRKRSLTSNAAGHVQENIVHGIASVFCAPEYRGRGYPQRMMRELAKQLVTWQTAGTRCIGSILYSDIGKSYYAKLGWHPNTSNSQVEFKPLSIAKSPSIRDVRAADLQALCERDEQLLRKNMATPSPDTRTRMAIIPDLDHVCWHLAKEEFACEHLFGKIPQAKGASVGPDGSQVWAIWTHRYYSRHDDDSSNNVLYILRLVMEADETATRLPSDAEKFLDGEKYNEQKGYLKAVLQAAQAEAFEWKLDVVVLWDPTPLVCHMLTQMDMNHVVVERDEDSIASGLWYDEKGGICDAAPLWVNNEHYAWL
ncbi:hypothetical protein BKA66DRAFT_461896 [Pyrenochaeta sp. MPI-SDFR-AT-0127]|nr:hypothetical protein BKA66DRAFT_461896 [Pyrenochaeta sp. MPI-SDFR-AT-0127]